MSRKQEDIVYVQQECEKCGSEFKKAEYVKKAYCPKCAKYKCRICQIVLNGDYATESPFDKRYCTDCFIKYVK